VQQGDALIGYCRVEGSGIDDWDDSSPFKPAISDKKPSKIIGDLELIKYTDGTQTKYTDVILMTNRNGTRLFLVNKNRGNKVMNNGKMLYFFYQDACEHCHSMLKWIDSMPIKVIKINVGKNMELSKHHKIEYTPVVKLFDGKKVSKTYEGEMTKAECLKFIQ